MRLLVNAIVVLFMLRAGSPANDGRMVSLGNGAVALTGPWKFHTGDDPRWADPGFDDQRWGTMDLTPPSDSFSSINGESGFVPGWTKKGYEKYAGWAWYRLHVEVQADGQSTLMLKMPDNVDDVYQVFFNGVFIGEFGRFAGSSVTPFNSRPQAFALPPAFHGGSASVAVRMYMDQSTVFVDPDVGGMHGPPVLGLADTINGLMASEWSTVNRYSYFSFFSATIQFIAMVVAVVLFALDVRERSYLWLAFTTFVLLFAELLRIVLIYTTVVGVDAAFIIHDAVLMPALLVLWTMFWASWFRRGLSWQAQTAIWSLALLLGVCTAMLRAPLYGTLVPVYAATILSPSVLLLKVLLGAVLVWTAAEGIRVDKAEGWLTLPVVLLTIVSLYEVDLLVRLHIRTKFFPFGVAISLDQAAVILSACIVTGFLLRRFVRAQREREHWRLELEQARQLQQILMPIDIPEAPAFVIASEYHPAQVVGGDFFQVLTYPADESILVVLGDVTGHGLQAGMLVALLVGAIRTAANDCNDPCKLLQTLNDRLYGRSEAYATCLALHLAADGSVLLANAGHLPPYLSGKELTVEGSLLLGLISDPEFTTLAFHMEPNETLVMFSDGVPESQDGGGQLFGFERLAAVLQSEAATNGSIAKYLASMAIDFGQLDDISVLSLTRRSAAER